MIANYAGFLTLGAICCAGQAFLLGAASLCVFWGPLTGAKIVPYRTAVLSEVGCQILGNVLFGPHHISPYAGVLNSGSIASVANSPELVMYALLCVAVFLPAWHLAALWQRVPLSPITGLTLGLAGTALIFPGPGSIDRGSQTNGKPPFLSGLGPLYIGWIVITLICVVCGGILMLSFRHVLRKEDPFSQIVWRLPAISCGATLVSIAFILYALSTPQGLKINTLSPQGAIVVICACGMGICIYTCLFAPCSIRRFGYIRPEARIRRMNLLGLPAEVVRDVAASSTKDTGWLKRNWNCFVEQDIFAEISKSDKLLRIHSSAEQYDATSEGLFHQTAIFQCVLLSMSYNGSVFSSAGGLFAAMLHIYNTGGVPETVPVPVYLRCVAAICASLGAILVGGRLMPVTGVQICKMTPIRACVVMYATAIAAIIGRVLDMDVPYVVISVSAVMMVGSVEGSSHVNWSLQCRVLLWWSIGFIPMFLVPAFLTWQGTTVPSVSLTAHVQADSVQIKASMGILRDALGGTLLPGDEEVADLHILQDRVQQLVAAYAAVVSRCANSTS